MPAKRRLARWAHFCTLLLGVVRQRPRSAIPTGADFIRGYVMANAENALDRHLAHAASYASRVRIVPTREIAVAIDEMEVLFPHEAVLNAPMGCEHVCIYTSVAPASLIDERIREHRSEVEHLPSF